MEMDLGRFGTPTMLSPVSPVTHKRIVEAATQLFLYRPMNEVSVDKIARAARVSRRALYDIRDRREELLRWIFAPLIDAVASSLPNPPDPALAVEAALKAHAEAVVALLRSEAHRRLVRAIQLNEGDHRWLKESYEHRIREPLYRMLKDGIVDRCAGSLIELSAADSIATRFYSILEAYAAADRALADPSPFDSAEADEDVGEFVAWFVRRYFKNA